MIHSDFVSHPAGFTKKCQPLTHTLTQSLTHTPKLTHTHTHTHTTHHTQTDRQTGHTHTVHGNTLTKINGVFSSQVLMTLNFTPFSLSLSHFSRSPFPLQNLQVSLILYCCSGVQMIKNCFEILLACFELSGPCRDSWPTSQEVYEKALRHSNVRSKCKLRSAIIRDTSESSSVNQPNNFVKLAISTDLSTEDLWATSTWSRDTCEAWPSAESHLWSGFCETSRESQLSYYRLQDVSGSASASL